MITSWNEILSKQYNSESLIWYGEKGIFSCGVYNTSGNSNNVIDYVTISTTGNATDFGDNTTVRYECGVCSNGSRGLLAGGYAITNIINYVTIASNSNAIAFGFLTVARQMDALMVLKVYSAVEEHLML